MRAPPTVVQPDRRLRRRDACHRHLRIHRAVARRPNETGTPAISDAAGNAPFARNRYAQRAAPPQIVRNTSLMEQPCVLPISFHVGHQRTRSIA
jgi:hypothetical protein